MKKLSRKEWVGVTVALIIVTLFLIFPQILRGLQRNDAMSPNPSTVDATVQIPQY